MRKKKKRAGLFLKILIAVLAVYFCVTLVVLQIQLNDSRQTMESLTSQRDEQLLKNETLRAVSESELTDEYVAQIAREELGLVMPNERLIVDTGY